MIGKELNQKFIAWLGSLSWPGRSGAPRPSSSQQTGDTKALCDHLTELQRSVEHGRSLHPAIRPPLQPGEPRLGGPHPLLLGTVTTYDPAKGQWPS